MENNVEKIFNQDIVSKKRTGYGIYKRASRKGFIRGGVKTQYDFMSSKERKLLNGEVRVYNMYEKYKIIENCPTREELLNMPRDEAKGILTFMSRNYTNAVLLKHLGLHSGSLYSLYRKIGVEYGTKEKKVRTKVNKSKKVTTPKIEEVALTKIEENNKELKPISGIDYNELVDKLYEKLKPKKEVKSNFTLNINGEYSKEELDNRILAISSVTVEGKQYRIDVKVEEI